MKILLLEDDIQLAESLGEYLEGMACNVDYAHTARTCLHLAKDNHYDVLILDIGMPGMSGLEACHKIRHDLHLSTPLLFLTARDTLDDKLLGFRAGCDDYLVKPFDPEELWCRLNALAARGPRRDLGIQTFGELTIDYSSRKVFRNQQAINLHATQFNLLKLLIRHSPEVVSKEQIEAELWGDEPPDSDSLRTHMYRLRNQLDKPFSHSLIITEYGKGYRFESR